MPRSSDADVDHLFQLPLTEFTAARNALAAELAKAGRRDDAARVRALGKPTVSAWTVNQLFWRDRADVDALLDVGERVRRAQAAQLAGKDADPRALLESRRDAVVRLGRRATAILRETGHAATPATVRRVMTTLEALAALGRAADAPPPGRLTADVDPPGFDALAGLVAGGPRAAERRRIVPLRGGAAAHAHAERDAHRPDRRARGDERRAAHEAVRTAELAFRKAERAAHRAKADREQAATRARRAADERDALAASLARASAKADEAAREAERLADLSARASRAAADAERDLERARSAARDTRRG